MPHPDPDRIAVAQLQGAAKHYARTDQVSEADALAELTEITEGLDAPVLLAEAAGILLGACRREEEKPAVEKAAALLRKAGAREALIPQWVTEGERRVEQSSQPPFGMKVLGT